MKPKEISRKGRELLAYVLCGRYGVPAEEIGTASRERGKPYLTEHPEIEFNISKPSDTRKDGRIVRINLPAVYFFIISRGQEPPGTAKKEYSKKEAQPWRSRI